MVQALIDILSAPRQQTVPPYDVPSSLEHPLRDSQGNTRRKRSPLAKAYLRNLCRTLRYIKLGNWA